MMRRAGWYGLAIGLLSLLVLGALGARMGVVTAPPRPDGPWMWVAARAAGVTALVALTLDVVAGLVLSTGVIDRWLPRARSLELHQTLSRMALALTAGHGLLLMADPFIRYDVLDVLVPGVSSYRPWAVAAGLGGAYLALVVHLSFGWRARLGTRTWRRLHYLSFAALAGAVTHGMTAGTDTGTVGMRGLYVTITCVVVALLGLRVLQPLLTRSSKASAAR